MRVQGGRNDSKLRKNKRHRENGQVLFLPSWSRTSVEILAAPHNQTVPPGDAESGTMLAAVAQVVWEVVIRSPKVTRLALDLGGTPQVGQGPFCGIIV